MNTGASSAHRHSHITIILLSVLVGAVVAGVVLYYPRAHMPASAQEAAPGMAAARNLESVFVRLAETSLPAVVRISATTTTVGMGNSDVFEEFFKDNPLFKDNPFFKEFGAPKPEGEPRVRPRGYSLGSGWIYHEDGYIVTNSHVVRGAEEIKVQLFDKPGDKREYPAKLVGTDPKTELALIKVDAGRKLPTLKLGNSTAAKVGQWVMAVGAPFNLEQTVTVGIISAKGRGLPGQNENIWIRDIIQTDASINPGNSGGPLVNLDGEVVGINVAIASKSMFPANAGVGFAIPADTARHVVKELMEHKKVTRGWLGVSIKDLDERWRDFLGVPGGGVRVDEIYEGTPASDSDLRFDDVITGVDGAKVGDTRELQLAIMHSSPGAVVTLDVVRDKKPIKIEVKLGEMPGKYTGLEKEEEKKEEEEEAVVEEAETTALGVSIGPLEAEASEGAKAGVLIVDVDPDGPAFGKLAPGRIITHINRQEIKSKKDFDKALAAAKRSGKTYVIVRYRHEMGGEWVGSSIAIEPEW